MISERQVSELAELLSALGMDPTLAKIAAEAGSDGTFGEIVELARQTSINQCEEIEQKFRELF